MEPYSPRLDEFEQPEVVMATPSTPPNFSKDRKRRPSTGFRRKRRSRHLKDVVFWELTDRVHYPRSPGTGHTIIEPVPFPYVPPTKQPGNEDDQTEAMNLDGTHDPEDSSDEDNDEDARERRN